MPWRGLRKTKKKGISGKSLISQLAYNLNKNVIIIMQKAVINEWMEEIAIVSDGRVGDN